MSDIEVMALLRGYRNVLLNSCDWTVMPDSPLSESKQTEWKTYRQSLRDITKTASPKMRTDVSNMIDVTSVTWPTKPS